MMRYQQTSAQRKASRRAIGKKLTGIFSFFRLYSKFQLTFALFSLFLSIVLLFIGTYAYYELNYLHSDEDGINIQFYQTIMRWYGIDENQFHMLRSFGASSSPSSSSSSSSSSNVGSDGQKLFQKLHSYQISMVFVAAVSILVEVGLISSIIFEHFKLTLLYNIIMFVALINHLLQQRSQQTQISINGDVDDSSNINRTYPTISLIYQVFFLASFLFYSAGIKIKAKTANRILKKGDIELRNDLQSPIRFLQPKV